jgi:hypothetical protein
MSAPVVSHCDYRPCFTPVRPNKIGQPVHAFAVVATAPESTPESNYDYGPSFGFGFSFSGGLPPPTPDSGERRHRRPSPRQEQHTLKRDFKAAPELFSRSGRFCFGAVQPCPDDRGIAGG